MPADVIVECPHCHSRLPLKSRASLGQRRRCPRCREPFTLQESRPSGNTATAGRRKSPGARSSSGSSPLQRPIVLAAIAGLVIVAIGIGAYALNANRQPAESVSSPTTDESPQLSHAPAPPVSSTAVVRGESDAAETDTVVAAAVPHLGGNDSEQPATRPTPPRATTTTVDWPQWRGPNRDGISTETGLLETWPDDGPPLAWRVRGLGSGMSSVAISRGRIYTLGNSRGRCHIHCRALEDGSEIWATPIGGNDPNCTPTVDADAGLVFGLTHDGQLACVDAQSGELVWQKSFSRDFGGKMMSGWGYSESPLVDGDRLICTPGANDAMIAALNKKTGETIWTARQPSDVGRQGGDGAAYSSVVISHGAGVKQYVQLTGRGLISVAADDGRTLWTYNRVANNTANVPTPLVKGDHVFCSTGYGTGTGLVKLTRRGNGVNAEEVWFHGGDTLQNHHGGMILLDDHVYMGHGHNNGFPVCVEFATGNIVWGGRIRGAGSGSAAIVCADGHLYFRYENAMMALIEATPQEYRLKGRFRIAANNGKSWPHPVVHGGRLYLRDQDELLCYDVRQ